MNKLTGKKILITGASQGLGRQLALDFARQGAAALSLVARHREQLDKVRRELQAVAPATRVVVIRADLSKPRDIERIIATTLSDFGGRVDVLVNNASTIGPSPMPYLDAGLTEYAGAVRLPSTAGAKREGTARTSRPRARPRPPSHP